MVEPLRITEVKRLSPHAQTAMGAEGAHRRTVERVKASLVLTPGARRSGERRGEPHQR